MPVLLAVIPVGADGSLARFVASHDLLKPAQHGYRHRNHAAPGERACELGGRPASEVLDELAAGRQRLRDLFGSRVSDVLVPPWNRIDADIPPRLPALGFRALSTFGPPASAPAGLAILNSDIDPIDWRAGRGCRALPKLLSTLVAQIDASHPEHRAVGLLTHHLAQDEATWDFVERCLAVFASHPAVRFTAADTLLDRRAAPISSPQ
jgi:hypothetical protein